jgi:hypothetical protein
MTNEERDIITHFIERVSGAAPAAQAGSVPAGGAAALPPIDKEADALIAELFAKYPDAKYRLTQTAFVQEHAMMEAQKRIQSLEAELQQARAQQPQGMADAPKSGGFLSGLFGGASRPAAPAPAPVWNQGQQPQQSYAQPQYAPPPPPQYAPQMMQQGGSGFLGSALRTAAGVAGGVVAGNLLMDAFSGHGGGAGASFGGGGGFMPSGGESPWASPAAPVGVDPAVDQGGWNTDVPQDSGPVQDSGSWADSGPSDGGGGDGGGWSDGGGGGGDDSSWT